MKTEKGNSTQIYGTFYAGGTAAIWVFNFSASLYVRLGMDTESGAMEGLAIFTFSFSMGIVDFDYRCEFSHKRNAPGGEADSASQKSIAPAQTSRQDGVARTTKGPDEDLDAYLGYFDLETS